MENATSMAGSAVAQASSVRLRMASVVAALALVFAMFVVVQDRAEASPAGAGVAVAASIASFGVDAAQIGVGDIGAFIRSIVCPILFSLRTAFSGSPFFGFVSGILNSLIVGFGCAPS